MSDSAQDRVQGTTPSRDSVVSDVLDLSTSRENQRDEGRELRRLAIAVQNSKGKFGLFFALCNDNRKQQRLIQALDERLRPLNFRQVELQEEGADVIGEILARINHATDYVNVVGIEHLLPSSSGDHNRIAERTLAFLQHRREQFRSIGRPTIFWMPDFVYTVLGQRAVDFWSWQSGGFHFTSPIKADLGETNVRSGERLSTAGFEGNTALTDDLRQIQSTQGVIRRPEMAQVSAALRAGTNVTLGGLGGSGKTFLARLVAQELRAEFSHVIYISCYDDKTASETWLAARIISQLVPEFAQKEDLQDLIAVYRSVLHNRHALIIIDDFPASVPPTSLIPPPPSVLLLISRSLTLALPDSVMIRLGSLTRGEARALLLRLSPSLSSDVADRLAEEAQFLPLVLTMMAESINLGQITPSELLSSVPGRSVSTLLEKAFHDLSSLFKDVLLSLLAFPATFDTLAESTVCDDDGNVALINLVQIGFVQTAGSGRYVLHDVVKTFLDDKFREAAKLQEARRAHSQFFLTFAQYAQGHLKTGRGGVREAYTLFELEWDNILAGHQWAVKHVDSEPMAARSCLLYADACAEFLESRAVPNELMAWWMPAWKASDLLNDQDATARNLGRLAKAFAASGQVQRAIELYTKQFEAIQGSDNESVRWFALGDIGNALAALGRMAEALECFHKQLQIASALNDVRLAAQSHANLGSLYFRTQELEQSKEQFIVALRLAGHDRDDPRLEMQIYNNLALIETDAGRLEEATNLLRRQLHLAQEIGDLRAVLAAYKNFGDVMMYANRCQDAISAYEESLQLARKLGNTEAEAAILGSLGDAYTRLSDSKIASELYLQAIQIARKGNDSPVLLSLMDRLTWSVAGRGDIRQAIGLAEETEAMAAQLSNPYSRALAQVTLALIYEVADQKERSSQVLAKADKDIAKLDPSVAERLRREFARRVQELFQGKGLRSMSISSDVQNSIVVTGDGNVVVNVGPSPPTPD